MAGICKTPHETRYYRDYPYVFYSPFLMVAHMFVKCFADMNHLSDELMAVHSGLL